MYNLYALTHSSVPLLIAPLFTFSYSDPDAGNPMAEIISYQNYLRWKTTMVALSMEWERQLSGAWNQSQQGPSGAPSTSRPSSEPLSSATSLHTGAQEYILVAATNGQTNNAYAHQGASQPAHREGSEDEEGEDVNVLSVL